ncbi:photosynthesis system II assembly factor YCF48-like protein [Algoriphagus boseongensis]|uniref:Photosynthesis system II assembly factor YCF48-like protein n=1 Tax=Algoriphagus boseongensis TaxID=1442587 RepID=A0A4R6T5M4_9BACT|nr:YCF48-related protein [Algoriphagus boseongensis]TDQ17309.1 photosynthesis system II assembly factor YCF48-like protein [Algoriphagus boseongensis]
MKQLIFLFFFFGIYGSLLAQSPQWAELKTPVKASLRGLSPVSDQICWASGSGGTWLKTVDGGKTWESGIVDNLDSLDFRSIHAFDEKKAIVASAGQPAVIYLTEDGGKSWNKVHQEGSEAFFDAVTFMDKKKGFVLGDPVEGKWMVLYTENGGNSWKSFPVLPEPIVGEAAFAASSSSMVVNSKELSFATGGTVSRLHIYNFRNNTWSIQELTEMTQGQPAKGVFAMAEMEGKKVLVGGDYTLLEDREGNSVIIGDFEEITPEIRPFGYRSGIAYSKKKAFLVAVGPSGSDFSSDFGKTWTKFSSIGFHAVKTSTDRKSIWASGSGGRIARLNY